MVVSIYVYEFWQTLFFLCAGCRNSLLLLVYMVLNGETVRVFLPCGLLRPVCVLLSFAAILLRGGIALGFASLTRFVCWHGTTLVRVDSPRFLRKLDGLAEGAAELNAPPPPSFSWKSFVLFNAHEMYNILNQWVEDVKVRALFRP